MHELYTLYNMKSSILSAALLIFFIFFSIFGCSSSPPEAPEPEIEEPAEPEPEPEPEPEIEEPETEPEAEEPEETVADLEPAEPEPEEDFVVTEEVFSQTFSDIESLIQRLNSIISASKFEKWQEYLTEEYKNHYSKEETLRELSNRPILQKYNIRLTSLKDYFNYVVVPSRSDVRLDDLFFQDNNHVKAIMIIDDQRVILYQLEKVDGEWKIGI